MGRQDNCDRVLECLLTFGPSTARDLAERLFGDGNTRTVGRTRVHVALGELERWGKITRKKPDSYAKGKGDLWRALPSPPSSPSA